MNALFIGILSIFILLYTYVCSPAEGAESYTSREFLERPQEAQDGYIQISMTMVGVVAARANPDVATCIDNWYLADDARMAAANDHIRAAIRQYADFHPSAVIMAVVEEQCGEF